MGGGVGGWEDGRWMGGVKAERERKNRGRKGKILLLLAQ